MLFIVSICILVLFLLIFVIDQLLLLRRWLLFLKKKIKQVIWRVISRSFSAYATACEAHSTCWLIRIVENGWESKIFFEKSWESKINVPRDLWIQKNFEVNFLKKIKTCWKANNRSDRWQMSIRQGSAKKIINWRSIELFRLAKALKNCAKTKPQLPARVCSLRDCIIYSNTSDNLGRANW